MNLPNGQTQIYLGAKDLDSGHHADSRSHGCVWTDEDYRGGGGGKSREEVRGGGGGGGLWIFLISTCILYHLEGALSILDR